MPEYSVEEILRRRDEWLALNEDKKWPEAHEAYLKYHGAVIGDNIERPVSPTVPPIETHLHAHVRLTNLQIWRKKTHNMKCPVIDPLSLIPTRPIKNPRNAYDAMYGQTRTNFTHRLLAWAMKQDPEATKELFDVVDPFAIIIRLSHMKDSDWFKCMPGPARDKVQQLCIVEEHKDEFRDFFKVLPSTREFRNLEVIQYLAVPRVSNKGETFLHPTHDSAVKHGMKSRVRLFFRWGFAVSPDPVSDSRSELIGRVQEILREATPGKEPDSEERFDVSEIWRGMSWHTYHRVLFYPWQIKSFRKEMKKRR